MDFLGNTCVCGATSGASRLFETKDYNFGATTERAAVMQCNACAALFPDRFPTAKTLAEAYAVYYTKPKSRRGIKKLLHQLLDGTRRSHLMRGTPRTAASVLDYGCGSGEFLVSLAESGYKSRLSGTDISQPQGHRADAFVWLSLDEFEKNEAHYDWITLSHVIEHLADPRAVLNRLKATCATGGSLWISTPNAQSVLIGAFRSHARDIDFPRHRQVYSRESLQSLLEQTGFNVTFAASPRVDAVLNFASCTKNVLRDTSLGRGRRYGIVAVAFGRLVLHLMKPVAWRSRDAHEIVAIATPASP